MPYLIALALALSLSGAAISSGVSAPHRAASPRLAKPPAAVNSTRHGSHHPGRAQHSSAGSAEDVQRSGRAHQVPPPSKPATVGNSRREEELEPHVRDRDRFFAKYGFGRGFVGWAGPVFWPYAYHDLLDYVFWPSYGDFYNPFWAYGYDEVFAGVFWPDNAARSEAGLGEQIATGHLCAEESAVPLALDRAGKAVRPTGEAQSKLEELERAVSTAASAVKQACPDGLDTAPARLEAVERRLSALIAAATAISAPLDQFYEALDLEQKLRLDRLGSQGRNGGTAAKAPKAPGRVCGQQTAAIAQFAIDSDRRRGNAATGADRRA